MTKLAPEWVRTSDPVIRSPARYRWTTAPACTKGVVINRYYVFICVVYMCVCVLIYVLCTNCICVYVPELSDIIW